MSTIIHVKAALHSQDIERARELLKDVLKHDPCEHSLYLAARLTSNSSQKIKYLKQALAHNPDHVASKKFLKQIYGDYQPLLQRITSHILNLQIVQSLRQQYEQLTFREHIAFLSGSAIVTVVACGLILLALFGTTEVYLPEVEAFSYVRVNNTTTLRNHFEANTLDLSWMELQPIPSGLHSGQYIKFAITESNVDYVGQILIYESYSAVASDIKNIKIFSDSDSISASKNSILIYASDLPSNIKSHLIEAHRTMPTIEISAR